jgi:hypothetical protein
MCFRMCLPSINAMSLETEDRLFRVVLFSYEHYFRCTRGQKCRTRTFSSECAKPLCRYFSFRVGVIYRIWIFRFPKWRNSGQQSQMLQAPYCFLSVLRIFPRRTRIWQSGLDLRRGLNIPFTLFLRFKLLQASRTDILLWISNIKKKSYRSWKF